MLAEFWGDLKKAVGAWRKAPGLPLLTVALQLPLLVLPWNSWWSFVAALAMIFYVGYVGTERLWYLSVWRNQPFPVATIWRTSWSYFRRFFRLGAVWMVAGVLLWGAFALLIRVLDLELGGDYFLEILLASILTEIWMTFMTPALAYSTDRVADAMSIGWRLLKEHVRRGLPYALAPPLAALALLQRTPPEDLAMPTRVVLSVIGYLTYLALKGATAAYYVRHHGVAIPDDEISVPTSTAERTA